MFPLTYCGETTKIQTWHLARTIRGTCLATNSSGSLTSFPCHLYIFTNWCLSKSFLAFISRYRPIWNNRMLWLQNLQFINRPSHMCSLHMYLIDTCASRKSCWDELQYSIAPSVLCFQSYSDSISRILYMVIAALHIAIHIATTANRRNRNI